MNKLTTLYPKKILIIDDSLTCCEHLKGILSDKPDYQVHALHSSNAVKRELEESQNEIYEPYDLFIIDIHIDEEDGLELLKEIRKYRSYRTTPALFITGDYEDELLRRAFDYGAFDYLRKPISAIELMTRVANALESHARQKELLRLAHYDGLTGLVNRSLLMDRLEQARVKAERDKVHFALLFIDVNYFKTLNDTYGHEAGDKALIYLSERLKASVRANDTVARLAGDEFVILLDHVESQECIEDVKRRIIENLEMPMIVNETTDWTLSISIGQARYPDDGKQINTLLHHADEAMYADKKSSGTTRIANG